MRKLSLREKQLSGHSWGEHHPSGCQMNGGLSGMVTGCRSPITGCTPLRMKVCSGRRTLTHFPSPHAPPNSPVKSLPASVFSNEPTLCMRWPKYWSFSFSIIPSKEIPGLISFRMDWLDLLAPWLPLETRPDSPGEPGGLPSMGSHRVGCRPLRPPP